jgi:hypothetical protein
MLRRQVSPTFRGPFLIDRICSCPLKHSFNTKLATICQSRAEAILLLYAAQFGECLQAQNHVLRYKTITGEQNNSVDIKKDLKEALCNAGIEVFDLVGRTRQYVYSCVHATINNKLGL